MDQTYIEFYADFSKEENGIEEELKLKACVCKADIVSFYVIDDNRTGLDLRGGATYSAYVSYKTIRKLMTHETEILLLW